jgi:hypothetical protein
MPRTILVAAALSYFAAVGEAAAQSSEMTLNGAGLLNACTRADHEWIGFCNGYIQAAFDATGGNGICAPKGVTRNQLYPVKAVQARTRWRGFSSIGQRHNECHLLNPLTPGAAALWG